MKNDDDYFTFTQQIAQELQHKDDLIYRTPNKFWQEDKAFFLFSQQSYFRRFWQFIGSHFIFQTVIIGAILLNCVQEELSKSKVLTEFAFKNSVQSWLHFTTYRMVIVRLMPISWMQPSPGFYSFFLSSVLCRFWRMVLPGVLEIQTNKNVATSDNKLLHPLQVLHKGSYLRSGWNIMDFTGWLI